MPSACKIREGLKETGHATVRTWPSNYRWVEDQNDQLPRLAEDLVRRQVTVIAAPRQHSCGARSPCGPTTRRAGIASMRSVLCLAASGRPLLASKRPQPKSA